MVVYSGLDEVSISGPTAYARLAGGLISQGEILPEDAGIARNRLTDLQVSTPQESAGLIEGVFDGSKKGACLDSILLNSGAAFMALDGSIDIRDGVSMASDVIGSGKAMNALLSARA